MEDLALRTGESIQLQIPEGDRMLLLDFAAPSTPYYMLIAPGTRLYWHGNAFGKAVMAFLPEEEIDRILRLPRPKLSIHTMTDEQRIRGELAEIRKTRSASPPSWTANSRKSTATTKRNASRTLRSSHWNSSSHGPASSTTGCASAASWAASTRYRG